MYWNVCVPIAAPGASVHVITWPEAAWFTAAVIFSSFNYLYRHRKAHLDVEWGKKHMPHHYDHHMGENQDANWCVSYPWLDLLLGTRNAYDGFSSLLHAVTAKADAESELKRAEAFVSLAKKQQEAALAAVVKRIRSGLVQLLPTGSRVRSHSWKLLPPTLPKPLPGIRSSS